MKRFVLVLIVALLTWPAAVTAADSQTGTTADQRGDYTTMFRELKPLAERGNIKAQFNLGLMYDIGRGVPQDYTRAYFWLSLAAAQGDSRGIKVRDALASVMTSAEVAEGQKMARNWWSAKKTSTR